MKANHGRATTCAVEDDDRPRHCIRHRWVTYDAGDTCPVCEDERTDPIPRNGVRR